MKMFIFEDFRLTRVQKVVKIESAWKEAGIHKKKPSRGRPEKDQWESVINAQPLSCTVSKINILFRAILNFCTINLTFKQL